MSFPRSSGVAIFLAEMSDQLLEVQSSLEDILLIADTIVPHNDSQEKKATMMTGLRVLLPILQEAFGKVYMAATTDCASVVEAMHVDDPVPGVSVAQAKAIRDLHKKKGDSRQKDRDAEAKLRNLQRQAEAATVAASKIFQSPSLPPPVPAGRPTVADGKSRFPCSACNKTGHWKDDGQCKPEDIRANVERLAALLLPRGQLALPSPSTSGSSGKSSVSFYFIMFLYPNRSIVG